MGHLTALNALEDASLKSLEKKKSDRKKSDRESLIEGVLYPPYRFLASLFRFIYRL